MMRFYSHTERQRYKAIQRNVYIRENPDYTDEEWQALKHVLGWCARCGSTESLTKDHIKPIGRGGENTLENLTVLCRKCNKNKGSMMSPNPVPTCLLPSQEQRLQELPPELRERIRSVLFGPSRHC